MIITLHGILIIAAAVVFFIAAFALVSPNRVNLIALGLLFIAISMLVGCSSANAGEPAEQPPVVWYDSLAQSILNSKGLAFAAYPTYGRDIVANGNRNPWGFGLALLYPVADYAYAGLRLDYLGGQFWAPSVTVGAKYTVDKLPGKPTVFTVGGLVIPLADAGDQSKQVGAIAGVGMNVNIAHSKDGRFTFDAFIEAEKWTNFDGVIIHPGVAGALKF